MTTSSDIHRRPDGSIDLDFYRQVAADERRQMLRRAFAHCKNTIAMLVAVIGARARSVRLPASPRPLMR